MARLNLLHHALFWTLLCVSFLLSASEELNITAGQDVTLTCQTPNSNIPIIVVEWSRADLKEEYVLMYRDGHLYPDNQHPSFTNRVDLQDRQMKDGDVSLILKDVTINDTGTYECRVFMRRTNRRKRANLKTNPISIISLHVDPPGHTGGATEDGGKEDVEKKAEVSRGRLGLIAIPSSFVVMVAMVFFVKLRPA